MKNIAVVDYGSGNIHSMVNSLAAALANDNIEGEVVAARTAAQVAGCDCLVLPGVGAFADCKRGLEAVDGMVAACRRHALEDRRPFLGVCVGMQLLADVGYEFAATPGFGWVKGKIIRLENAPKLPHMGWNELAFTRRHPLTKGLGEGSHFYFDHSYIFANDYPADLLASCEYGKSFAAAVARDNVVGVQFHPEKSQTVGLGFLANFIAWRP